MYTRPWPSSRSWHDQNSQVEDVRQCYNWTSLHNFEILLKMWTISGWLGKTTLKYFLDINRISRKQSGFRPGDSCVNQFWQTRKALCLLMDFLKNCQQRVVLNSQFSSWAKVNAGVPQGPISRPLLFLIKINDLPDGLV